MRKRRYCLLQAFSPFLTMFSTAISRECVKCGIVLYWFNPFPNKPWLLRTPNTNLLKTLREKEKLLVTSNFSFSHSVSYQFEDISDILITHKIVV